MCRLAFYSIPLLAAVAPATASAQTAMPLSPLLAQMAGTWDVTSRIWTGPRATPEQQPAAVAVRTIPAGGGFIEETLESTQDAPVRFTRTAIINYSSVEKKFEYASVDSRAPQLMHYSSAAVDAAPITALELAGGRFVAAEWGQWRNTTFAYRIALSPVTAGRQTLRIYFTPITTPDTPEFLATQYDYVKRPR